jgi:hypothetical protein
MSLSAFVYSSVREFQRSHSVLRRNPYRNSQWTNPRVEVLLRGGLGNQLFGFSAGTALAMRHGVPLHLVTRNFTQQNTDGRTFELSELLGDAVSSGGHSSSGRIFREWNFAWDSRVETLGSSVLLDGYFQSSKYFGHFAEDIQLAIKSSPSFRQGRDETSKRDFIALQVRRGDYLKRSTLEVHGLAPESYFMEGVTTLRRLVGDLPAIVFSDDLETAKNIASLVGGATAHSPAPDESSLATLGSMSAAKGLCISNSSFGWWGAYLAENQGAVVTPRPWFANPKIPTDDLLEQSWLSLGFRRECDSV